MAVWQRSTTDCRVLSRPPARLMSSSRLRRLAPSRITVSSRRSWRKLRRCGRAVRWVSLAYANRQPAAPMARVRFSQPKPLRSWVPNCWHRLLCAVSRSKSHGARRREPRRFSAGRSCGQSSGINSSTGFRRSSSASRFSQPLISSTLKRPLVISSTARPNRRSSPSTAANRLSRRSSSRASSLTVPGVMMRTT